MQITGTGSEQYSQVRQSRLPAPQGVLTKPIVPLLQPESLDNDLGTNRWPILIRSTSYPSS